MTAHTILVVDDDLLTLKVARAALESAGYLVLEARHGQSALTLATIHTVDLILQALHLLDMDGAELLASLRALPDGAERPILALVRTASEQQPTDSVVAGFTGYCVEPIAPARLLGTIRAYLAPCHAVMESSGRGRHILVVDDDARQRRLLKLQLEHAGFRVTTAADGLEVLKLLHIYLPDAILSDVLMPGLDGFNLCRAVRQDSLLGHIPVVLISAATIQEVDRRLARDVGASALLSHRSDVPDEIARVLDGQDAARPDQGITTDSLAATYTVEHQDVRDPGLAEQVAWLEAQRAVLARLTATLTDPLRSEDALDDVLHACLQASGLSRGAIYLRNPQGRLSMRSQLGYAGRTEELLPSFFGHAEYLEQALQKDELIEVSAAGRPDERVETILAQSGDAALLIMPLVLGEERLGLLMVASSDRDLRARWGPLIRALGNQISQAIMLARALARLRDREERLNRIIASIPNGISIADETGRITLANTAMETILGLPRARIRGRRHDRLLQKVAAPDGKPVSPDQHIVQHVLHTGEAVHDVEQVIERPDGRRVIVSINASPLRSADGTVVGCVTSLSDITARKQDEEVQQQARERAERAVRLRDVGVSVAAHELKAPLASLLAFTQFLHRKLDQEALHAGLSRDLRIIEQQAVRLERLISQLLDVARIERGSLALNRTLTNITRVVSDVVAIAQARSSTHTFVVEVPPSVPAYMDPLRLEQLLTNLVDNAIKYSPEESPITVTVSLPGPNMVSLTVRDLGPGIPVEKRAYIFDRYYQAHSRSHSVGLGLGLYICRQIAELHGGRIGVECPPEGGSLFVVSMPTGLDGATAQAETTRVGSGDKGYAHGQVRANSDDR